MSSLSIIMKNQRECYLILFIFNNLCAMNESNEKYIIPNYRVESKMHMWEK